MGKYSAGLTDELRKITGLMCRADLGGHMV